MYYKFYAYLDIAGIYCYTTTAHIDQHWRIYGLFPVEYKTACNGFVQERICPAYTRHKKLYTGVELFEKGTDEL